MSLVRGLPDPPYYAVIFNSRKREDLPPDYAQMAQAMDDLAAKQPGFLGLERQSGPENEGITISYWRDEASIRVWRNNIEHAYAMAQGRDRFYEFYEVRVARVERAYSFDAEDNQVERIG